MIPLRRPHPTRLRPARLSRRLPATAGALVAGLLLALSTARTWHLAIEERARARRGDAGYSTEAIAVTAVLVAIAIAVATILGRKVIEKVSGIQL